MNCPRCGDDSCLGKDTLTCVVRQNDCLTLTKDLGLAMCIAATQGEHRDLVISENDECFKEAMEAIRELYDSNEQHEQSFELRHKADVRGIKAWQEKTGKTLKMPDHADLVVFLATERDQLKDRVVELEQLCTDTYARNSSGVWFLKVADNKYMPLPRWKWPIINRLLPAIAALQEPTQ